MTDEYRTTELAAPAVLDAYPLGASGQPGAEPPPSPFAAAHRLLTGRYLWALGIGSVFAAAGAVAGFTIPKPSYRSIGLIEVAPKVNKVIWETDEKGLVPMYEPYVESQVQIASSRRVIDMAMGSPEWRALGRGISDVETARFAQSLFVEHRTGSQCITVSFSDLNPDATVVAVNQVMKAYLQIVKEREALSGQETREALEKQRAVTESKIKEFRQTILQTTDGLGADGLEASRAHKISEMTRLETEVHNLDLEIATARAASNAAANAAGHVLAEEEIAARDPNMQTLLLQKAQAEDRLKSLIDDQKLGENHPAVGQARKELETVKRQVASLAQHFRQIVAATPEMREAELREKTAHRADIVNQQQTLEDDIKRMSAKCNAVENLKAEQVAATEKLDEIKRRQDQINVESQSTNRISALLSGERPTAPEKDRRVSLAVGGGLAGIAFGFGLVLLWGLREGRMRHVMDVDGKTSRGRFLGVVPDVEASSSGAGSGMAQEMGDYCVHHIRTMLQLRSTDHRAMVTLTSPSPGAGKTTLGLALGTSFAAAGSRTLLIDFDFVGHGLTTSMRSLVCDGAARALTKAAGASDAGSRASVERHPDIMSTLVAARSTSFSDEQVEELLAAARDRAASGDESAPAVVRALEALRRPDRDMPTSGRNAQRGVLGALRGVPVADCVIETGFANLSLLPVGDAREQDARSLSRAAVERLLTDCRDRYDVVLIDSGPVLGSIEAAFAAAATKDVLLVVTRGERRPLVDDAVARVERIGASIAGVVFNRASTADVARSNYASRSKSIVTEGA